MKKNIVMKKTIKPSQRDSITGFSTSFGSGHSYEVRKRRRRALIAVCITLGVLLLFTCGYFISEVMIDVTELPV